MSFEEAQNYEAGSEIKDVTLARQDWEYRNSCLEVC
jgi:hypothetical protein